MKKLILGAVCGVLLFIPSAPVTAETHKKVQAALEYELPVSKCKKPYLRGAQANTINDQGIKMEYDVDHYKIERYERKMKWTTNNGSKSGAGHTQSLFTGSNMWGMRNRLSL